jgi:DNA-binding MarR family transcriptional regulator
MDSAAALQRLLAAAAKAQGALAAAEDEWLGELGLTSGKLRLLEALSAAGAPRTVPQLARALGVTRQAVQRVADETAAKGFVQTARNPEHARAKLYLLTAAGAAVLEKALHYKVLWLKGLSEGLPVTGLEIATELLALTTRRAARKSAKTG